MDLYVDGNIAQMFSPEGAVQYFARLLGVDSWSLHPTVSKEPPHAFFITSSAVQSARPSLAINGRPLDYVISHAGTVVPQRMWFPPNPTDAQRFANVSLNMPIFFVQKDRMTLGLSFLEAVEGAREILLGAEDIAPVGGCSTTYIRINVNLFFYFFDRTYLFGDHVTEALHCQWPGYRDWSSQIMTRDQTTAHNTIILDKFARRIANAVGRFLDVSSTKYSPLP
jgi:hypothetical protein